MAEAAAGEGSALLESRPDPLERSDHWRLVAILGLVLMVEGADIATFGASFHALERDLGIRPSDLARMAVAQSFCAAAAGPVWGVLADRQVLSRRAVLAFGCFGWGLVTVSLGLVSTLAMMVLLRAMNGVMLASLNPICQGIVADTTAAHLRGRVFGTIMAAHAIGSIMGNLVATPLSNEVVLGAAGWRVAFISFGAISMLFPIVIHLCMPQEKPRPPPPHLGSLGEVVEWEMNRLRKYLSVPTFNIIVAQGIFGATPWHAMSFLTMYFQLAGVADARAALLISVGIFGGVFGNLLGGVAGDYLELRFPGYGRPLTAQLSVCFSILAPIIIFESTPSGANFPVYLFALLVLHLLGSWCAVGVNRPILADLVAPEDRSSITAWWMSLEGSCASLFGAPAVGFLAERVFGYPLPSKEDAGGPDAMKAAALGRAMLLVMVLPWAACFCLYSALHFTVRRDTALMKFAQGRKA